MIPFARYLPACRQDLASSLRRRGRGVFLLQRRDAVLGTAVTVHRNMPSEAEMMARWQRADAVFLPGVLGDAPQAHDAAIAATRAMFDRLRDDDADFLDELEERLADDDRFRYAGSTIDQDDPREIERVFVDALDPDAERPVEALADDAIEDDAVADDEQNVSIEDEDRSDAIAKDLWAKLAWITAEDPSDRSLRIRFSNGLDQLEEWLATGDHDASMGDLFALRAFPECAAMLTSEGLRTRLDRMIARPHRLSERIIYNNAPNGGAIFHHDAEPGQIGVVFAQLEGRTAWLTLPKRRLATLLKKRGYGGGIEARAIKALDGCSEDDQLQFLLNRDESFAAELAAAGALYVLEAGDAIVLPSHSFDDVAWHSVLAVGDTPSLAHSYGIFPRDDSYDPAGDPWLAR